MIRSYYSQSHSLQANRKNSLLVSSTMRVLLFLTASFLAFWLIAATGDSHDRVEKELIVDVPQTVAHTNASFTFSHLMAKN